MLRDRGRHRTDAATGALVYHDGVDDLRLWVDPMGRVDMTRVCYLRFGQDCDAAVRLQDHTLFFPVVHSKDTETKAALLDEATVWRARFDRWRCPKIGECVDE